MGRTSIPCSDRTRDELADLKPENATWDEFLRALADVDDGPDEAIGDADLTNLKNEVHRLRNEFDEFKHQLPRDIAEQLRP